MRSWYQWSRPSTMSTSWPVRRTTTTSVIDGVASSAASTLTFSPDGAPPPPTPVGGDHDLGLGVVDAVDERVGREPAEDHRVGGAEAGAGEHGHGQLGDHRHVDGDPVALLDAQSLEHVGEPADLVEQVGVGDGAGVTRLALPVEGDLVALAGLHVAVEAVVGDVQLAVAEPPGEGQVPFQDRREVLRPGQQLSGLPGPEGLVVGVGLVVERAVGHQGVGGERGGRRKGALLPEVVLDGGFSGHGSTLRAGLQTAGRPGGHRGSHRRWRPPRPASRG